MDAHVGRYLFEKLIGNSGILQGKTRVLVTHNLSYLHKVDRILVMMDGRIVEQGHIDTLKADENSVFQNFANYISASEESFEEMEDKDVKEKEDNAGTDVSNDNEKKDIEKDKDKGKLISKEVKAEGSVDWKHYRFYLKSMTIWKFVVVCIIFLVAEAFKVGGNLILAEWTKNFDPDTNWNYIGYYCLLAIACSAAGN